MKYLIVQAYWYFDKITGEYHYRIGGPGDALASDARFQITNIHIFHPLFPQLAEAADLLILHLLPDPEVWKIIHTRRQAGKATIFEIADNFLAPGPWVSAGDAYRNPEVRQELLWYAALCDAVQYSTAEVAAVFAPLHPQAVVFENQVNHFSQVDRRDDVLCLGWGGSIGHRNDLAWIAPTILRFCKNNPNVRFHYMGHPPIYHELFADLGAQGRLIPSGPVQDYYAFLEGLHIGIAPLEDSEFNRCRSDVKFIEYAAHGVLPLLAHAAPYRVHGRHGENALFFESPEQLGGLLDQLAGDRALLARLAGQAFHYAREHRDRQKHVAERVAFYLPLLPAQPGQDELPELPDCSGLITYMRSAIHAYDGGRFDEALTTLDKVLQLYPSYQLAQLYRGKAWLAQGEAQPVLRWGAQASLSPIYGDLHCELLARAARAIGNAAWRDLAEMVENPVLRIELLADEAPAHERAQAILGHQAFHHRSLQQMCAHLPQTSPEWRQFKARLDFIDPEDPS